MSRSDIRLTRRALLSGTTASLAVVGGGGLVHAASASKAGQTPGKREDAEADKEILGQGNFRYRTRRYWGHLDRSRYPVKDCHGITEDRNGRIVLLTNDTHNNLIAYRKNGEFQAAWENRFPAAHGLEITEERGEELYWITDHDRQVVSTCMPDGREVRSIGPDKLASKYPDLSKYHPTNTAILPDGQFFISDGYGSSFVHQFDPDGRYVSSFGGEGDGPENLKQPHAVWIDARSGTPQLLVCDRQHQMLKWFSLTGDLLGIVPVPGALPSNVSAFGGKYKDCIAVASLNGMILVLDGQNRVISVVGGEPPVYVDSRLQTLSVFNYTFNHPHDVYVDATNALYVVQWWSNQTYPIKLDFVTS